MRMSLAVAALLSSIAFAARAGAEDKTVVFVVPAEGSGAAGAREAIGAIRAQLGDVPVRVVVEPPPAGSAQPSVRDRIEIATALAKRHGAVGTFWLDTDRDGDTLLYLIEPDGKRVLVRRVRGTGAAQASLEEVAVIARSTVSALLEGGEIGMQVVERSDAPAPVAVEPRPAKPPRSPLAAQRDERKPERRRSASRPRDETELWVGAAYAGTSYAPQVPWQSGVALGVALAPRSRLYFGAGYTFYVPADADAAFASLRVTRHPLEALVGYQTPFDDFSLGAELAAIADYTVRTTTHVASGYRATPEETGWEAALSPRVRLSLGFLPALRVSAGVGIDVVLNGISYEIASESEPVLDPGTLRPRVDLGIAVDAW